MKLYIDGAGLHVRGLLVIILLLLPNIIYFIFPPKKIPENLRPIQGVFSLLEKMGRIICFVLPIIFGKMISLQKLSYVVILMGLCLFIYYICWTFYFVNGREYYYLFKPLGMIPIPMAIFPLLYFILLGVWLESPVFLISVLLFSIGHIAVSWNTYIQIK
jgi:hypothetical protein